MAFRRIAIVNRGEPAMRLINAVAEYNREYGADLVTIALYTEPDRTAMFVREADEAYPLGPAHRIDRDGNRRVAYVDHDLLAQALAATEADAVWVGWGFVAEDATFVELCERLGVTFIGPSADVMRRLGDKITSKQIAQAADVPVAPWSGEPVETVDEARRHAERLHYPVLIKASAGGGGRGIRRVERPEEMADAFRAARTEAGSAFGNPTVFLESLVTGARHIEVQIIGDAAGTVWPVGVRDCSAQRRNQKLLEEAPSPVLAAEREDYIKEAAARLGRASGYQNAGTVEFLYRRDEDAFYFMEVNTRLQVEHPITEVTTGLDLVKLQLAVALGERLEGPPPVTRGHAIEARLNAEDPDMDFAPAPGAIQMLRLPVGPGLRIDTGVEEGDVVAAEFDSMIAKVIASGRDRTEAIARLRRALRQMNVFVADGATNKAFLDALLRHPDFVESRIDVGWVDRMTASDQVGDHSYDAVAIVVGAIAAYRREMELKLQAFRTSSSRGRPQAGGESGETVALRYAGERYSLHVSRLGEERWRILVDDLTIEIGVEELGRSGMRVRIGGRTYRIVTHPQAAGYHVEVEGVSHRINNDEGGVIRAPSPAVVVSLPVAPGQTVAAGDRLAVIEAMKMETSIFADFAGVVREVIVAENVQVAAGSPLLVVDPLDETDVVRGERVRFDGLGAAMDTVHDKCAHYIDELRLMVLGWDTTPRNLETLAAPTGPLCAEPADRESLRRSEEEVLRIFTDIISLFRRVPIDSDVDLAQRTDEEYLFIYLRDLDAKGQGLPETFLQRIQATLAHYGIEDLEHSSRLEEALFRIAKSYARMHEQTGPLLRVLEDRLDHGGVRSDSAFRSLLERIIAQSVGRYPALHDMARDVHFQAYDVPFLDRARRAMYAEAERQLARLAADPDGPDRTELIRALVECPQALAPVISERFAAGEPAVRRAYLEVMTRRWYRIRDLQKFTTTVVGDHSYAHGQYEFEGRWIHVITGHSGDSEIEIAASGIRTLLHDVSDDDDVVVDLYLWRTEHSAPGAMRRAVKDALNRALGDAQLRRIVVVISGPRGGFTLEGVEYLTYRPDGSGGYREQEDSPGVHPMIGKRLELWRLENFEIRRLPSLQDIYLFHGVARDNARDERLFAVAEVRDLTPIRDADGRVIRVPEFERVYRETLAPMRRFQAHRPDGRRLSWNRVTLYVWPVFELSDAEVAALIDRLAADTEGLGLQRVSVRVRVRTGTGKIKLKVLEISNPTGREVQYRFRKAGKKAIRPLRPYDQAVVRLRRRGLVHPHELVRMLTTGRGASRSGFPPGSFLEYDMDNGELKPVERGPGENTANVVVGVVSNTTPQYPEGMDRVIVLSDPTRGMGSLAEAECVRIIGAIDLAADMGVPLEWFAVSAGALISMESGTENMDWIARVLRRIVEFTQAGGEINIVVCGVNVGAQPYWNAEATMLMHTSGILVMTPRSAMVLTGKEALDYSGGVSADDNRGIGGYERIMGPNGQAQYFAEDLAEACLILLQHYECSYVMPGERFPRARRTDDPIERDVTAAPHGGSFATLAEVFSETTNPGRKRPFEMRKLMAAVVDADLGNLERWQGMRDAEVAIVWDAFLGGQPVSLIGFEAQPLPRLGPVPADGPTSWTSGTLFPRSSKKTARAINAASGNRPVVVLANLSGFDGSPESMRSWQLEYGAEIGRAVVNFAGPMVFCVVSRYHGGAFVVFSHALHDNLEVVALEGSHASVIGGAPAAAVVFAREVRRRTDEDVRVLELEKRVADSVGGERAKLAERLEALRLDVHSEKLGEVAEEFDAIHNVRRALEVGSVQQIIPPAQLRPYLIDAIRRGIAREMSRVQVD